MHDDPTPIPSPTRAAAGWLPLAVRSTEPELLDGGDLPPAELRRNLADLARLNRLPGGTRTSVTAIAAAAGGDRRGLRVLDVGTGAGDMPLAFADRGWSVVGVEPDAAVAAVARETTAPSRDVTIVEADGRALPYEDGSFDVAHASLLLHHLDPSVAVSVLREMGRVARSGVVINDLRRGILPLLATGVAVAILGRCRTTRHDGLLSVRRAYRLDELDELLVEAGLQVRGRTAPWMPRIVTIAAFRTDR